MKYQTFSNTEHGAYPIAVLVPKLDRDKMAQEYLDPISLDEEEVVAYELHKTGKKTSATSQKQYLDDLLPILDQLSTEYLIVGDGEYFKTLTGVAKSDAYLGYALPNTYPTDMQGRFTVILVPNYRQVFYDPQRTRARILQGMDALYNHRRGLYREPGCSIIKFSAYPMSATDIGIWLQKLLDMDCDLTCDIEGFSLKHYSAGIGTISFAWNQHEGIAFPVDLGSNPPEVRQMLINFFKKMQRKVIYHNISYDATVLIYQLFMKDIIDTEGLLDGLDVILKSWDDTKLISYLATNTCAGNNLGLKDQAQEFAGNYAVEEIKDITSIPLADLLEYNLIDCLATWYVRDKHWDTMIADQQHDLYEELFKPAIVDIIQMQLTGMPLDMDKVKYANRKFEEDRADAMRRIQSHILVQEFTHMLDQEHVEKRNSELKTKRIKMGDEPQEFNANSGPQKQRLFYELLGMPIIERTKTKQPGTGAEVLEKLKAYTDDQTVKDLIDAFLEFAAVDKLYSTFMPPMLNAVQASDGAYYLFGNFNLGGTVSGRLSSSDPNLQTIPSKKNKHGMANYAKLIKDCFRAPEGWVMIGLDFSSLEDRISALTTEDPNKLKVYTDGFDGHCLRAYSYFEEKMPDIDGSSVDSINSIADKYPDERQMSKTPTFALTYQGTWITLVAKCGFSKAVAMQIEARYHELYKVSDEWVAKKLNEASQKGYIEAAFGLKVRTPLLAQVIRGNSKTPHEAEAEGRTAGNALGQSWCLLNSRASVEFMRKVRSSRHRLQIRPIAHIHDAQYYLIPDQIEILKYVNKHLVKAVEWQDHPAIWHDEVKLGGELSVFHPSWANEIVIPNHASEETVLNTIAENLAA